MRPAGKLLAGLLMAWLMAAPGFVVADDGGEKKARRVNRTAGLSYKVYEQIQQVQTLVEEGSLAESERRLREMQQGKLSDYEMAQTWFLMGYVYFQREDFDQAQEAYEKVLANESLPLGMHSNVLRTLAQLTMVNGEYRRSLQYLDELLELSKEPQADYYALQAQAYYQLEEFEPAMTALERAIEVEQQRGAPPRESWLLLKNAILYQREDFPGMLAVVQLLVELYPKERYLLNMAAIYAELGDSKKQLSLMEPLYERGSLNSQSHKVNLASLYLFNDVPYKAAILLERELDSGDIEHSRQHLEMLAQAWLMSANVSKATGPLAQAAELSDDGETYLTLARTYLSLNQWSAAEDSLTRAQDKGGLRDEADVWMLKGMAQFNQGKFSEARRSFARAGENPRSEKLARQWIEYLGREEEKLELARQAGL